ncbi:MAG: SMC-Scp complex subunit ScpB [Negativicutes bacterium]|nr:SMC-Scp complex subunit ScpB [Negativicutes bacterium]
MFYRHLKGHIEALLFASGEPLALNQISDILEVPAEQLVLLLAEMKEDLADPMRGLTIVEVAGGYQLCTKPELAATLEKLDRPSDAKLSPASLETLAIIAFKQPITRQEIESIRGVKVDRVLGTLLERRLIREQGRKEAIGRPILYGTTEEFLKCFGLNSLKDLPELASFLHTGQPE